MCRRHEPSGDRKLGEAESSGSPPMNPAGGPALPAPPSSARVVFCQSHPGARLKPEVAHAGCFGYPVDRPDRVLSQRYPLQGNVRSMWGTVLLLALVATADPVRNGTAALLCSRPRPMLNLLAFWFGGVSVSLLVGLGSLFVLRGFALTAIQHLTSAAATSSVRHMQVAAGVFALLVAARILSRERARLADRDPSVIGQQASTPGPLSWLSTRARDALEGSARRQNWLVVAATSSPGHDRRDRPKPLAMPTRPLSRRPSPSTST
jgi:Sap, sulfolipid-1-addressing protein